MTIPGLTVKTPANQTITCNLENDLTIGSTFPCKASVTIGGNELTFHSGEVLQGQTGIQLRITSDPVYPVDNLILTGVNFEVTDGNAPLIGTSFEIKTQQLSLFLERDTVSSDQQNPINLPGRSTPELSLTRTSSSRVHQVRITFPPQRYSPHPP